MNNPNGAVQILGVTFVGASMTALVKMTFGVALCVFVALCRGALT